MASIKEEDWGRFGFNLKEQAAAQPEKVCTCPKCGAIING